MRLKLSDPGKRTLADGRIPAPHSGILTYIASEIGSRVAPGQKVAVVSDLSSFKIKGEIPDGSSDRVAIGSKVLLTLGAQKIAGRVTNISPQSKQNMIEFAVSLDNPRDEHLRPGLKIEMQV